MTFVWRWINSAQIAHASEPDAHRALCGADVLNAAEEREPYAANTCRFCRDIAERFGHPLPATSRGSARSADRSTFNLPL